MSVRSREERHAMHFPKAIRDAMVAKDCWVCSQADRIEELTAEADRMTAMATSGLAYAERRTSDAFRIAALEEALRGYIQTHPCAAMAHFDDCEDRFTARDLLTKPYTASVAESVKENETHG